MFLTIRRYYVSSSKEYSQGGKSIECSEAGKAWSSGVENMLRPRGKATGFIGPVLAGAHIVVKAVEYRKMTMG